MPAGRAPIFDYQRHLRSGKPAVIAMCSILVCGIVLMRCESAFGQAGQKPAQDNGAKIAIKVDSVLIPVLVRDAQGRAVGDLKQEDFELFDRGKKQTISGFSMQQRARAGSIARTGTAAPSGNHANPSVSPETGSQRFVIFLFDDLHLDGSELALAQHAGTQVIAESLRASDMAAVLSISGTNSGLTRDRGTLKETIAKLHQVNLYRHAVHECPEISYYEADLIQNKHQAAALETAMQNASNCANLSGTPPEVLRRMVEAAALHSLAIGDQDVHVTLGFIGAVVRKMSSLSGQRTLVLVSPGFLTITPEAMEEKSRILDLAAQSDITISALDARGLYSAQIDASERGAGSARELQSGNQLQYRRDSMSQNEDVMAELADGSGGTYFHNSNDLQGGFQQLTATPEYMYLLELSLQNVKRNGSYHHLTVKVDRVGVKLQARQGYFAPKPAQTER
jgi:VWFA-related protein